MDVMDAIATGQGSISIEIRWYSKQIRYGR